jgi:hypothetical protein
MQDIIDYLQNRPYIDETLLSQVRSILFYDKDIEERLLYHFESLNIPLEHCKIITNKILTDKTRDKVLEYLDNRDIEISSRLNMKQLLVDKGISNELLNWILNYKYVSIPCIGSYELFLSIFLKDGLRPPKNFFGDVYILKENKTYLKLEIKGNAGRLAVSNGSALDMVGYWRTRFIEICKELEIELIKDDFETTNLFWNFTKPSENWGMEKYTKLILQKNPGLYYKLVCIIEDGFNKFFTEKWNHEESIGYVITYCLDKNTGVWNKPLFIKLFFKYSFLYYKYHNKFDYLVFGKENGIFIFYDETNILDGYNVDFIVQKPNFSRSANVQSMCFGLIDKKSK